MPPKFFKFHDQLKKGKLGEELFIKCYPGLNPILSDDKKYDILVNENEKLELKSDSWSMSDTPNFFFEKISHNRTKTIGGVYRTSQDGIDHFVYLFVKDLTFFWFNSHNLVQFLEWSGDDDKRRIKYVKNKDYYTIGSLFSREECKEIILRVDRFDKNFNKLIV